MEQEEIYSQITSLLNKYGVVTREERDHIISLVKSHYIACRLTMSGPCLQCETHIEYIPFKTHISQGDKFLKSVFGKWNKNNLSIDPKYNQHRYQDDPWKDAKIGQYRKAAIWGYLCNDCQNYFIEKLIEAHNHKVIEVQQAQQTKYDYDMAVVSGKIKASPYKRYQAAITHITPSIIEQLKELPYKQFLESNYWKSVRGYKLYRAGYKCELCNSKGQLNVHHKTYEHHGKEHYYLDDLIVLCHPCHAKFHGKLVPSEGN